jgi:hypothetical protein
MAAAFFVLVLDKYANDPNYWIYDASSSSETTLKGMACYNDPPESLPKGSFVTVSSTRTRIPPCKDLSSPSRTERFMGFGTVNCRILVVILILLVIWGCTSNQVVGRYKRALCQTGDSEPVACNSVIPAASAYAVSIVTPPAPSTAGIPVFPERALAAYIKALANPKISPTAKDLQTNLAAALTPALSPPAGDRTVFHRTIMVTVRKRRRIQSGGSSDVKNYPPT